MQSQQSAAPKNAGPDIIFHCQSCEARLVVNCSAAGVSLPCSSCGKTTTVPKPKPSAAAAIDQAHEIELKLKENESQRTEIGGYINQLSIQLHRWQLRLQTLNERKEQLEKELGANKA